MNFKEKYTNLSLFILIASITLVGRYYHELWRDEYMAFSIASVSDSLVNLYQNLKYEVHPMLWYIELWLVGNLYKFDYMILHYVSGANALIGIALLMFLSPFNWYQKLFIGLSTFVLYEYSVISRSYSLLLPLCFYLCHVSKRYLQTQSKRDVFIIGLLIFLIANISLLSLIITIPAALIFVVENPKSKPAIGIFVYTIMVSLLVVISIYPPKDFVAYTDFYSSDDYRIESAIDSIIYAFTNMPDNFAQSYFQMLLQKVFYVFFISVLLIYSIVRKKTLFVLGFAVFLTFAVLAYTKLGTPRHYGHIWLFWVMLVWINYDKIIQQKSMLFPGCLNILLAIQAIYGVDAICSEIKRKYSHSEIVRDLILEESKGRYIFFAVNNMGSIFKTFSTEPLPQLSYGKFTDVESIRLGHDDFSNRLRSYIHSPFDEVIFNQAQLEKEARKRCVYAYMILEVPLPKKMKTTLQKVFYPRQGSMHETMFVYRINPDYLDGCVPQK